MPKTILYWGVQSIAERNNRINTCSTCDPLKNPLLTVRYNNFKLLLYFLIFFNSSNLLSLYKVLIIIRKICFIQILQYILRNSLLVKDFKQTILAIKRCIDLSSNNHNTYIIQKKVTNLLLQRSLRPKPCRFD
jgi:hypothetical protein